MFTPLEDTRTANVTVTLACMDRKKSADTIETQANYINIIKNARDPAFMLVNAQEIGVKNFEAKLEDSCEVPKNWQVSKFAKINYYPNGQVDVFENYDGNCIRYTITSSITLIDLKQSPKSESVGITAEKKKMYYC